MDTSVWQVSIFYSLLSSISRYFAFYFMLSPIAYYQQQAEQYTSALTAITAKINGASRLRFWLAVATMAAFIYAFRNGVNWQWWLTAALAAAFAAVVRRHLSLKDKKKILDTNLLLTELELKALSGDISHFPDGAGYTDTAHPYSYDLDLFGKGSVYQLLCRSATNGSAALLAEQLQLLTLDKAVITGRQEIIRELATRPELLQAFRVAGASVPEGAKDQHRVKDWLQGPDLFINNILVRIAAVLMPLLSLAGIAMSIVEGDMYAGLGIVIVINWVLLGSFQKKTKTAAQQIGNSAPLIDKYAALLGEVASVEFTTPWLKAVGNAAKTSVAEILRFKKLVHLFDSRSNGMTGPLMNTFFLFDFYCLLRLERWRKKHSALLLKAIDDMIAADAYVSCAVYAFNHPANVYPEINTAGTEIYAKGLKHPLLQPDTAVGNDVSIGNSEQFYLLTGANMTGKSTFIRTIGISNILANLGLPLPASELSLPLLDLYTSMRITDSVQDDISYFRAELNRIKAIMDKVQASGQHYLVLLDEPLRGTNSTDKQQGTRAIVEALLTCKAIGIVATHDTGLCDMEDSYPGKVSNYHFESTVETAGLSFDFRLKPGPSTSNNATILMRQMGIIK